LPHDGPPSRPGEPGHSEAPETALRLSATVAEVNRLDRLHENAYLRLGEFPVDDPAWDVGVEDMLGLPYFTSSRDQLTAPRGLTHSG
jgi:hypothetical protein